MTSNVLTPRQLSGSSDTGKSKTIPQTVHKIEDKYPDLYLAGCRKLQNTVTDSMDIWTVCSADNNPVILVELTGIILQIWDYHICC